MRKIVVTVGCVRNGKKKYDSAIRSAAMNTDAEQFVGETLSRWCGGFTVQGIEGGWLQDEKLIHESGLIYTVFDDEALAYSVQEIARFIRGAFRQDCALLEVSEVNVAFVE
jgi:hypothetical protein